MIPKVWTLVFSEVISDSNKTIDDQYLNLTFFSSKVAVCCCSVESVFWNFPENTPENTCDGILQL